MPQEESIQNVKSNARAKSLDVEMSLEKRWLKQSDETDAFWLIDQYKAIFQH